MGIYVCLCVSLCMQVQVSKEAKGIRLLEAEVIGSYEPSSLECWEPNMGPLQEEYKLLTTKLFIQLLILLLKLLSEFYIYLLLFECVFGVLPVYLSIWIPHTCLVLSKDRRWHWLLWDSSHRWLWANKPWSSSRATSFPDHWVIFLAPPLHILKGNLPFLLKPCHVVLNILYHFLFNVLFLPPTSRPSWNSTTEFVCALQVIIAAKPWRL